MALHALFEHDVAAAPNRYHRGMCRLWRRGLPQVNLLANRAVPQARTIARGALADDGEPCGDGNIFGMEAFAWHSDEASRPRGLPVRTTAFHADVVPGGGDGETHFADGRAYYASLGPSERAELGALRVRYASSTKSYDAFLPPYDVAGKRDALLRSDGTAKVATAAAANHTRDLLRACLPNGLCEVHASPLFARHPRTGVAALHVDVKQQLGLEGMSFADSQRLLRRVVGAAAAPEKIYRHRWEAGDVVVTDNFAALHTAAPGLAFNDRERVISRVCLPGGHAPVAVTTP